MPLSPADIVAWDATAVREVSAALAARQASAEDVHAGLRRLPMITSWQGSSGDAAREALDRLAGELRTHGLEMARLSAAANTAADEIEHLQAGVRRVESDAGEEGFGIDMATGQVIAQRSELIGDPIYTWQQAGLQTRLDELVEAADAVDADLAAALTATGGPPAPAPAPDPLSSPIPLAPREFHDFWVRLTNEQKDTLYRRDNAIGNRNGMPAVDRDYYNRQTLADRIRRTDARADLEAVARAVDGSGRLLLVLDTDSGHLAHAAIAVGDPDTADHVSVTTPGLNTTVRASLPRMTEDAVTLRQEAMRQLQVAPDHSMDAVSTIAWVGYDTPQFDLDDVGAMLSGGWDVSHGQLAARGAVALADFYDGLVASHHGPPPHLTAIGHSYGSLTTGLALQEPGDHGVTDVVFYGSPGVDARTPADLQVADGHVFAMRTPDDPIRHVFDVPLLHAGAAVLPAPFDAVAESMLRTLQLAGTGQFGPDPATNPHFTRLETSPVAVADGSGVTLRLDGAGGHSDYPRLTEDGRPRTTTYNLAAVVAGLGDRAIRD